LYSSSTGINVPLHNDLACDDRTDDDRNDDGDRDDEEEEEELMDLPFV